MSKKLNHHKCMDCKVQTNSIGEHYMLKDETWNKIHNSERGMLCIGCAEKRLGRVLNMNDFNSSHVNRLAPGKFMSVRMIDRLKRTH